jgi:hypothetical protein
VEPSVSVVLPCLNEAAAIGRVVERAQVGIAQTGLPGEVVVVDNGSTDATAVLAARAGARVVREPRQGYGRALQRGFAEARGTYIVMADGDETYPVDRIAAFIDLLRAGCDLVYGDRFAGGIEPAAMAWSHRYIGTPVLSWLVRRVSGTKVADSQCGMRAFRADALRALDLQAAGMELNMEMLVKAGRLGLRIGQVPITLGRRLGQSKLDTIPDGWRNLRYLLLISPNHLFMVPGVLLLLLGVATLGLQALLPRGVPIGSAVWRSEYAPVVLGSVGSQIIWFGVLAKLHYAGTGLLGSQRRSIWPVRGAGGVLSLERLLVLSLAVLALGGALEVVLGLQQFAFIAPHAAVAAVGAFAVLVGLQSFFGSFVAYLLASESTPPATAFVVELQATQAPREPERHTAPPERVAEPSGSAAVSFETV